MIRLRMFLSHPLRRNRLFSPPPRCRLLRLFLLQIDSFTACQSQHRSRSLYRQRILHYRNHLRQRPPFLSRPHPKSHHQHNHRSNTPHRCKHYPPQRTFLPTSTSLRKGRSHPLPISLLLQLHNLPYPTQTPYLFQKVLVSLLLPQPIIQLPFLLFRQLLTKYPGRNQSCDSFCFFHFN